MKQICCNWTCNHIILKSLLEWNKVIRLRAYSRLMSLLYQLRWKTVLPHVFMLANPKSRDSVVHDGCNDQSVKPRKQFSMNAYSCLMLSVKIWSQRDVAATSGESSLPCPGLQLESGAIFNTPAFFHVIFDAFTYTPNDQITSRALKGNRKSTTRGA